MVSHLNSQILVYLLYGLLWSVHCNIIIRNEDICGVHNGRRLYLELGEKGTLYAKNVSFIKNSPRQQNSRLYMTNSSHDQCSLELVTCPSCAITVTFKNLALPHSCGDSGMMMDSPCRCDYVWISEPPYEDISGTPYCGLYSPITYRSSTRTVSITLFYSKSHKHAFTLEYTSERNKVHLKGWDLMNSKGFNNTVGGVLTSPFFPARYPRDLGVEYIITCPTEAHSCRIRVLFSDFQLATVSIIEFYDWNGQRLDVSSGARFRPPIIVSSGPSLLIRFYANGGTGLGYKAFYSYILGNKYDKTIQPITDCGGYVENLGGTITMMDMVVQGLKTYDCVWLIRPPKNFLHTNTHMYIKVVTFSDMGNTELTIRQGPTSALLPLEVIRHPTNQLQPLRLREHVAPITSGFHVSLRGVFGVNSRVAIAYAAFGYMDCFSGSDFLCQNHRCIQSQLNCDGFDHCGDNSDEPASCFRDWDIEPRNGKWHANKANYYFPKIDRYPDLKTATLVFVASSLGLIILISALIVLLYRMGARSRQQRELQSRLQTISELLDRTVFDIADGGRIDEITVHDEPPVYEAPPGYDEVIKIGFENEGFRKKKKRAPRQELGHHSSSNQRSLDLGTTSQPRVDSIDINRNHENNSVVIPTSDSNSVIPQSPPPPYITPSESVLENFGVLPLCRHNVTRTSVPVSARGERVRRAWRQNSEHRRSFPCSDESNIIYLNASVDFETISSYLRHYTSRPSTSSDTFEANIKILQDPDSSMRQRFIENLRSEESTESSRSSDQQDQQEAHHINCTCEGACGCANEIQEPEVKSEEYCPKQTILKLFKSSKPNLQNFNYTTLSTTPSIKILPSDELAEPRTISACSGEAHYSRKTSLSTCCTPDVFEIMSIASATHATSDNVSDSSNSPIFSPIHDARSAIDIFRDGNVRSRQRLRKYISYDAENFYESLKNIDNFIARRNIQHNRSKSMSATASLFGTPTFSRRRYHGKNQAGLFDCVRGWKSNDDTLSS
ncbi:uncharacterized protein Culd isoform X2 [Chelonus insularis]|uniref:uncharacterized protein Culd isoform X2 n=1 Tax=Chelonus insularis TaxID=460826 RepID=UPI00158E25E4|nr:uncharacterized protein LOC118073387 isoform X2 [Chelonus insularis]